MPKSPNIPIPKDVDFRFVIKAPPSVTVSAFRHAKFSFAIFLRLCSGHHLVNPFARRARDFSIPRCPTPCSLAHPRATSLPMG